MLCGCDLCLCEKGGDLVGPTKKGKGSKIMAICDGQSLPVSLSVHSATPHEVTLVEEVLEACFTEDLPERMIGDRAFDSDDLDIRLAERGIQMIAPHRKNRVKVPTQDGRVLRRYKRRWKIERFFAWLQSFRRIRTRDEVYACNYEGMVHLGCIVILLRCF
jgi:transposase